MRMEPGALRLWEALAGKTPATLYRVLKLLPAALLTKVGDFSFPHFTEKADGACRSVKTSLTCLPPVTKSLFFSSCSFQQGNFH